MVYSYKECVIITQRVVIPFLAYIITEATPESHRNTLYFSLM